MANLVLDRLRTVLKEKKVSQRELAKGINVSLSTVNKLLNSEDDLSLYVIRKIAKYIGVSEDWLLVGKGSKYEKTEDEKLAELEEEGIEEASALKKLRHKDDYDELLKKYEALEGKYNNLKNSLSSSGGATVSNSDSKILFLDSKSALTYPEQFQNEDFINDLPSFTLPVSRFPNKNYRAFEITGDAMSEKIANGDWVICEKVEDFRTIKDTFVYVVVLDYEIQCRRVLNRLKERSRLRLKCDNKFFRDVEITQDQIKEVWEVKSVMTFSLANPFYQLEDWVKKIEDRLFELEEKVDGR